MKPHPLSESLIREVVMNSLFSSLHHVFSSRDTAIQLSELITEMISLFVYGDLTKLTEHFSLHSAHH